MKKYIIISVAIWTAFFMIGCRKLVDTEYHNFIPSPVINSIIKAGDKLYVHASVNSKYDAQEINGMDNAVVKLFADDIFIEQLSSTGNGLFISEISAEPMVEYVLQVSILGFSDAICKTIIPSATSISGIEHIAVAGKDVEGVTYPAIKFNFHTIPQEDQYFEARLRLIRNGNECLADIINITDPILLNEGLPLSVFSNNLIHDTTYTMRINYTTGSSSSTGGSSYTDLFPFILEIRSVSKDYYLFARQKYLYDSGRFPEFGLSTNTAFPLYSNVENGYGIFAGYSVAVSDTIYPHY